MFGQPLAGTDKSPQLLREAGLRQNLTALGWRVEEMGDVVRHHFAQDIQNTLVRIPSGCCDEARRCFLVFFNLLAFCTARPRQSHCFSLFKPLCTFPRRVS